MYCINCGESISDKAVICPKCKSNVNDDNPTTINVILSFLIPIVGIIMGIVLISKKPISGKTYLYTGLGSIPIWTLINISIIIFLNH